MTKDVLKQLFKELGWDEPFTFSKEKTLVRQALQEKEEEAEQRGYERGKRESHPIHRVNRGGYESV